MNIRAWMCCATLGMAAMACDQDTHMGGDTGVDSWPDGTDTNVDTGLDGTDTFDAPDGMDVPDVPPDTTPDTALDTTPPPDACTATSDLTLSLLRSDPFHGYEIVDETHDLLIIVPEYVSTSTDHLMAVDLTDGAEEVISLPIAGDVELVDVRDAFYDRSAGRSVLLAYAMNRPGDGGIGDHMELLTLELDGSGTSATLTQLTPTNAPPSEGYMFSGIWPEGDGTHYRAFRWSSSSVRAAVSGTTVVWETEVDLTASYEMLGETFVHDPTGNRLLTYGAWRFEGTYPDITEYIEPWVYELSLAGGTSWSQITPSGDPPPTQENDWGFIEGIGLWDDQGSRLVALQDHPWTDPWIGEYTVTGVWTMSDTGNWSVINEDLGYCCAPTWLDVIDHERRRTLQMYSNTIGGIDLSPGSEGQDIYLALQAPMQVTPSALAFEDATGILYAGTDRDLLSMDVRGGDYTWRWAAPDALWPDESRYGTRLNLDDATGRLLISGGKDVTTTTLTSSVYSIDPAATTPDWTLVSTSGTPPAARWLHSTVVDQTGRIMYVVGGSGAVEAPLTNLDDVVALDLATNTWSAVATLPVPRFQPLVWLSDDATELYVAFGAYYSDPLDPYTRTQLRDAYRVTLGTGAVETLTVTGDMPDAEDRLTTALDLPSGMVILVHGYTEVTVLNVAISGTSLTLTRESVCEEPRGMGWGQGAVDPTTGVGYVAGNSVWSVTE